MSKPLSCKILQNLEAGEWSTDRVPSLATGELAPERAQRAGITLFGAAEPHPVVEKLEGLDRRWSSSTKYRTT